MLGLLTYGLLMLVDVITLIPFGDILYISPHVL